MIYVVPTLHPAFAMRGNRRMEGIIKHDLERALEINAGAVPVWRDKEFSLAPKLPEALKLVKAMAGKKIAVDIETDGRHPLLCSIRCIGLYDGVRGVCLPLLHRDGSFTEVAQPGKKKPKLVANWSSYYGAAGDKKVLSALQALFSDKRTQFYVQNGQYDRLCMRARLGLQFDYQFDTVIAHHVLASYMPHSLGFIASIYTDICYYKKTEKGQSWSTQSDSELWLYNLRDVRCTHIAAEKMKLELQERSESLALYRHDHRHAHECEEWKENGLAIDIDTLRKYRSYYQRAAAKALDSMRAIAGGGETDDIIAEFEAEGLTPDAPFKPGSLPKLRAVLLKLGIPLTELTASGDISTGKEYLLEARKILLEQGVAAADTRVAFLDYLFAWREAMKLVGTYLSPDSGSPEIVDGRVHPTYNCHVVPSGRLSSSSPNIQNQPKEIRGMYVARPNHKLVSGDWDSLELRLTGYVSGERAIIDAFTAYDAGTGPKIHKLNCSRIFGIPLEGMDTDAPNVAPLYRAAKAVIYAITYGGGEKTAFETARKEMPDLTFAAFRVIYKNITRAYPTMFAWQKSWVEMVSRQKYLDSPVLKRRMHFFEDVFDNDSPEAAAMLNSPMQSAAADVAQIANFRIMDQVVIPMRKRLRRGEVIWQISQIHDELLFEVPTRLAEEFAAEFKRVAELPVDAAHKHWKLPVDVQIKDRWAKVPKEVQNEEVRVDPRPAEAKVESGATGGAISKRASKGVSKGPRAKRSARAASA